MNTAPFSCPLCSSDQFSLRLRGNDLTLGLTSGSLRLGPPRELVVHCAICSFIGEPTEVTQELVFLPSPAQRTAQRDGRTQPASKQPGTHALVGAS